jgi:hypothetical protein
MYCIVLDSAPFVGCCSFVSWRYDAAALHVLTCSFEQSGKRGSRLLLDRLYAAVQQHLHLWRDSISSQRLRSGYIYILSFLSTYITACTSSILLVHTDMCDVAQYCNANTPANRVLHLGCSSNCACASIHQQLFGFTSGTIVRLLSERPLVGMQTAHVCCVLCRLVHRLLQEQMVSIRTVLCQFTACFCIYTCTLKHV